VNHRVVRMGHQVDQVNRVTDENSCNGFAVHSEYSRVIIRC